MYNSLQICNIILFHIYLHLWTKCERKLFHVVFFFTYIVEMVDTVCIIHQPISRQLSLMYISLYLLPISSKLYRETFCSSFETDKSLRYVFWNFRSVICPR